MTSLQRFKALLPFMTEIYSKTTSAERTACLEDALLSLATLVNPVSAEGWATVRQDADRIVRLWGVKESDPAANEMATQLLGMIESFIVGPDDIQLVIEEKERPAPTVTPPAFNAADFLPVIRREEDLFGIAVSIDRHSHDENGNENGNNENPRDIKVVTITETAIGVAEDVEDLDQEVEEEGAVGVDADDNEDEVDYEEEDNEEEDNDNEDNRIEVQKIFVKGRAYWLGSDQKIYACADDDEIGEEIGELDPTDKKPRFY
jgi:hypothetical protein